MIATHSRGIRLTSSGVALARATTVSGITIVAITVDTLVKLRDGGVAGPIIWEGEADNATSSLTKTFNPPLKFFHSLYVEMTGDATSSVSLEVIEP